MNWVLISAAWTMIGAVAWSVWSMIRDAVVTTKQMHKIPCTNCQFFTGNYYLKCTIRPKIALTEEATSCSDYCPKAS